VDSSGKSPPSKLLENCASMTFQKNTRKEGPKTTSSRKRRTTSSDRACLEGRSLPFKSAFLEIKRGDSRGSPTWGTGKKGVVEGKRSGKRGGSEEAVPNVPPPQGSGLPEGTEGTPGAWPRGARVQKGEVPRPNRVTKTRWFFSSKGGLRPFGAAGTGHRSNAGNRKGKSLWRLKTRPEP